MRYKAVFLTGNADLFRPAEESLYVDDYKPEADGAREQGFTSFLIDRSGNTGGRWTITSLRQMIDFVENMD